MAYKCLECGHIFEFGEEAVWPEPHGELMTGCPKCHSAYATTVRCFSCHGEYLPDDIYDGSICKDCLIEKITPDRTARYVQNRRQEMQFYVGFYFNSAIDDISDSLLNLSKSAFFSMAGFESLGANNGCSEKCRKYVVGDGQGDLDDFAHWMLEGEP